MCIMHPKYKSTPATNSCNRGGFIRKGVLTLPAPFFTQLQINLWYKNLAIIYYFTQQNKSATAVIVVVVTNILI